MIRGHDSRGIVLYWLQVCLNELVFYVFACLSTLNQGPDEQSLRIMFFSLCMCVNMCLCTCVLMRLLVCSTL